MGKLFKPPSNWSKLYAKVKEIREEVQAPVDTVGCSKLFDPSASDEVRRYHILLALMLSAQTKDHVTAAAMHSLIDHGCTPETIYKMPESKLNEFISKVGFHNTKARNIKAATESILQLHKGTVPRSYEGLVSLPGVGPKMAHLFLQEADSVVIGIGVDTHVHRIAQRFHWVPSTVKSPEDTRKALEAWLPAKYWGEINGMLVGLGQTICTPRIPRCSECPASGLCPSAFREAKGGVKRQRLPEIEDVGAVVPAPKRKRI
ncbi:endonuclease III, putative [Trypanosoma equiperdum]|uniref:Endonuclease III homolog n=4 Tax=Trypanozoon TaxID=39700 RepID=Q382X2_TRYB2|nr:endonuclease III, putative [Trypanosoma brucei brucei TREU927]EAN80159.1 endonuclease III, putative [Trypanosoma brucei brucei TREU927]RHW67617.1 endonuclease III [Trypanosoma brucei equiperdum]SCU67818.1 endonuclease III, putative [Trypanosoma equiperdum]